MDNKALAKAMLEAGMEPEKVIDFVLGIAAGEKTPEPAAPEPETKPEPEPESTPAAAPEPEKQPETLRSQEADLILKAIRELTGAVQAGNQIRSSREYEPPETVETLADKALAQILSGKK